MNDVTGPAGGNQDPPKPSPNVGHGITTYRFSWTASTNLAKAVALRCPQTGQQRPLTRTWRVASVQMAIACTINPADTIVVHRLGASAKLTNLCHARLVTAFSVLLAIAAGAFIITSDSVLAYLPAALICYLAASTVVTAALSVRKANSIPAKGTHLLSEVARHPNGTPGAGKSLIDNLTHLGLDIIGTTTGRKLWERVYQGRAEIVDTAPNEQTDFRIRPSRT